MGSISSPFYKWGVWGIEKFSNLLKVIELVNSRVRIQAQAIWLQSAVEHYAVFRNSVLYSHKMKGNWYLEGWGSLSILLNISERLTMTLQPRQAPTYLARIFLFFSSCSFLYFEWWKFPHPQGWLWSKQSNTKCKKGFLLQSLLLSP